VINARQRRGQRRLALILAGAAVAAIAVTGCSSSGGNSGGGGSGNSSGSTSSSSAAGVAWAKALIAKYGTRPTSIPSGTAITTPVPTGKNIAFINCPVASCGTYVPVVQKAADVLGWKLEVVPTDGTPESQKQAWATVFRKGYDGVIFDNVERPVIDAELKQAASKGLFTVGWEVDFPAGEGLSSKVGGLDMTALWGEIGAAEMIAESNGKGNALLATVTSIPAAKSAADGYLAAVRAHCPDCSADLLDIPLTALGKDVPQRIVSALRAKPNHYNYLPLGIGPLLQGLPSALSAASIKQPHIITLGSTDPDIMQAISDGQMDATVGASIYGEFWAAIDALARHFTDTPQISQEMRVDPWVITKSAVLSTTDRYPFVADMVDQYKRAWGRS
jgi:ribose transport system substrate-binding protein